MINGGVGQSATRRPPPALPVTGASQLLRGGKPAQRAAANRMALLRWQTDKATNNNATLALRPALPRPPRVGSRRPLAARRRADGLLLPLMTARVSPRFPSPRRREPSLDRDAPQQARRRLACGPSRAASPQPRRVPPASPPGSRTKRPHPGPAQGRLGAVVPSGPLGPAPALSL